MNARSIRNFVLFSIHVFALIVWVTPEGSTVVAETVASESKRPNVLFIAVDDLRPELASYGKTSIKSPNIDRLAANGVKFDRAYCMVPTCGASRASLFSGLRPTPSRFVSYTARIDQDAPNIEPMHTCFKNSGYYTQSIGKILHFTADRVEGWSQEPWRPTSSKSARAPIPGWNDPKDLDRLVASNRRQRHLPFGAFDVADEVLRDGQIASEAIAELKARTESDQPFFMAVGFLKPHLPFEAPLKYWQLHDPDTIELPENYYPPKNAPSEAIHSFGELRSYVGVPAKGPVTDEMARTLIHGYAACVSYTDAQIGRVLNALNELGLTENTIIVLWGDHGWNLGEHTLWCKHCTFENAMRVPLIISTPGRRSGETTRSLTETIDIYPTLCDLAGIEKPKHLAGESLVQVLDSPEADGEPFAIGRFKSGDTIRTDRWRYTEYAPGARNGNNHVTQRMLYDLQADPEENVNVVDAPENSEIVQTLSRQLAKNKGKDR